MTSSQHYYDEFSSTYEAKRHRGYHRLIDSIELEVVRDYCRGHVLEAGCGTGLILQHLHDGPEPAIGLDLSAGMLAHARARGLIVVQGSVDAVPFPSNHFDGVVSFKVLAHVQAIERAIAELARVTRAGGHLVLEFYNRYSLRALIKNLKRPDRIGTQYTDEDVYTRFDSASTVESYLPPWLELVDLRGVRVVTPVAQVHDVPLVRDVFAWAERRAANQRLLKHFGGFLIAVLRKRHS